MRDFIRALLAVFVGVCAAGWIVSAVQGSKVECQRPLTEDAYGWYAYQITHTDDEMELLEYEMGLYTAMRHGALTESERETLFDLAEARIDD